MNDPRIYQIGLTMINGIGDILARHLLETMGNAEAVFTENKRLLEKVSGIGSKHIAEIRRPDVLKRAEEELLFIDKNKIQLYYVQDHKYPYRLKECPDAPVVFYCKGKESMDYDRIISIVGTRQSTSYGRDITEQLIHDLAEIYPQILIVSGLAYGIDIHAHRTALKHGLPTIAVLAHGLDTIYPSVHRGTAIEMLANGGLITDYPSKTKPDKPNFVKRNRIVAGMSDATVVIESGEKGGSLITADIAFSYGRDVYSFPGRIGDPQSKGCNGLIRNNKAGLITSANDLIAALCWQNPFETEKLPTQMLIPFAEDSAYYRILSFIQIKQEIHINQLAKETKIPVYQLSSLLFELEMENYIKTLPGGMYRLS